MIQLLSGSTKERNAITINVYEFLEQTNNFNISNAIAKTWDVLGRFRHPVCSISGGSDSDIILDMVHKLDEDKKVKYIWFNTGLEYSATKKHLEYLENKYKIEIERVKPVKTIPQCVHEHGLPFMSKLTSEILESFQRREFNWHDDSKMPISYRRWWNNEYKKNSFKINNSPFLKEYIQNNPPTFKISAKCCHYAKKLTANRYMREHNYDLSIIGVRKAEGGVRNFGNNCFTIREGLATFRPIFWLLNQDKEIYKKEFNIRNSDCYEIWGLKRTGCVGCPFGRKILEELEIVKQYEPNMYKAAWSLFGESYEYTKKFREFQAENKEANKC